MCGIAGLIALSERTRVCCDTLRRVNSAQSHRGPDDEGYLLLNSGSRLVAHALGEDSQVDDDMATLPHIGRVSTDYLLPGADIAVAHRRLSILDTTSAGHQPMSSADGRHHLVYNGEVYNYTELREQLRAVGWQFHSESDTEVVLAACATWGTAAFRRMVGMFALAWIDLAERRVVLARDVFGIKPLHYFTDNNQLAFASEPAPLLEVPGVERRLDPHSAYTYLRYNITDHDDRTFFDAIRQLPPAHYLSIDLKSRRIDSPVKYWSADRIECAESQYTEAVQQLRDLFLDSVRIHLRSDVPVAVMLSGGIDSSCVTMSARRSLGPDSALSAFGYIAPDPRVDESRWMNLVKEATDGLSFHAVQPSVAELTAELDRVIRVQQAPFGSLSVFAQNCVFRAVQQQGIKVILSGQGADELLGGYAPFAAARLISIVRRGRLLAASRFYACGSQVWPGRNRMKAGLGHQFLQFLPPFVQSQIRRISGKSAVSPYMNERWLRDREVQLRSPRDGRRGRTDNLRTALRDSLTRTGLPELLRYEDRNSMAYSVESRVPFLTAPFVEFLLSLPEHYIINDSCIPKAALRDAMRGIVPDPILDRRDKVAFSAPLRQWFPTLRPYFGSVIRSDTLDRLGIFHAEHLRQHWNDVEQGTVPPDATLWRWVNLIRWADIYGVEEANS
jgi:asparagine synthase (glutamine-hydrolysing)